jgi:hypothetical protein
MKNQTTRLVNRLNSVKVQTFFRKYPRIKSMMQKYVEENTDIESGYNKFLEFVYNENHEYLGAKRMEIYVEEVGICHPWQYDYCGIKGFKEAYQYIFDIQWSSLRFNKNNTVSLS